MALDYEVYMKASIEQGQYIIDQSHYIFGFSLNPIDGELLFFEISQLLESYIGAKRRKKNWRCIFNQDE